MLKVRIVYYALGDITKGHANKGLKITNLRITELYFQNLSHVSWRTMAFSYAKFVLLCARWVATYNRRFLNGVLRC